MRITWDVVSLYWLKWTENNEKVRKYKFSTNHAGHNENPTSNHHLTSSDVYTYLEQHYSNKVKCVLPTNAVKHGS